MKRFVTKCPVCQENLKIAVLQCPDCGLEMRNALELGPFDRLSNAQYDFLMTFLKHRGNLKNLQSELQISYPLAKRKLDDLLATLGFASEEPKKQEKLDMKNMVIDYNSKKASEIIKAKLMKNGGRVLVHTLQGLPCEVKADADGESFLSDKLPIKPPYQYEVFDVVVELLLSQNGRARKGNGRSYKLGHPQCDETTVVGAVAKYCGKRDGESVFDPVFVLAAVLDWAGIAHNERGELVLTANYRSML